MSKTFKVGDADDPSDRRDGVRLHAGAGVPAEPDAGGAGRRTAPGCTRRRWMPQDNLVLCFQSYVVQTGSHNILVDSCIGNDKERTARPLWHKKKDDAFMRGLAAAGPDGERHRLRHVHASARRSCRLEHAAGERPLGADLPQGALPVLQDRAGFLAGGERKKTDLPQIVDSVIPIVEAKRVRPGHQRPCAGRPGRADPDARPHHRPLRGHAGQGRQGRGDHRRPDPHAAAGALSRAGDAGRLRPGAGRGDARRRSWRPIATPTRCAASRISRRRRAATSSAGATGSNATT